MTFISYMFEIPVHVWWVRGQVPLFFLNLMDKQLNADDFWSSWGHLSNPLQLTVRTPPPQERWIFPPSALGVLACLFPWHLPGRSGLLLSPSSSSTHWLHCLFPFQCHHWKMEVVLPLGSYNFCVLWSYVSLSHCREPVCLPACFLIQTGCSSGGTDSALDVKVVQHVVSQGLPVNFVGCIYTAKQCLICWGSQLHLWATARFPVSLSLLPKWFWNYLSAWGQTNTSDGTRPAVQCPESSTRWCGGVLSGGSDRKEGEACSRSAVGVMTISPNTRNH